MHTAPVQVRRLIEGQPAPTLIFQVLGQSCLARARVATQVDPHAASTFHRSRFTRRVHSGYEPMIRARGTDRSEEHTSELQSLMRISYAVFCLKKKQVTTKHQKQ